MNEQGRFGNNGEISAFEENAELLKRETAEKILAGSKRSSDKKSKTDPAKTGSEAAGSVKTKNKDKKPASKPGKTTAKGAEKSSAAENKGKPGSKVKDTSKKSKDPAVTDETTGKNRVKKNISESLVSELTDKKPSKRTAKKSVQTDESITEQADNQPVDDANRTSCKTPQVMKLIEDDSDELVIYAGKSRVPKLLRGRESLSRLSRKSADNETEVVNITELVIKHEAADILDRFNACSCEKCVQVFSEMISQRIPVRYARISRSELELDELPERAVPMRKVVLPEMIRELICNKKRSFHDK